MIENNTIILPAFNSPLETWHPTTAIQTSIYTAVLTTLLSYQLTAIICDLLQGLKPRNHTTASALHARLLSINPSPLALLSTFFRHDSIDRLRFRNLPPGPLPRTDRRPRKSTLLALVALVSAPFITNLLSIFLTIETTETIPLSKTPFKGVALGFGKSPGNVDAWKYGRCVTVPFIVPPPYKPSVDFVLCHTSYKSLLSRNVSNQAIVGVTVETDGSITGWGITPGFRRFGFSEEHYFGFHASLRTEEGVYRIWHQFDIEDAKKLINMVQLKAKRAGMIDSGIRTMRKRGTVTVTKKLIFPKVTHRDNYRIQSGFFDMRHWVTLVDANEMKMAREGDERFHKMDVPLLERRAKVLSEGFLGIVVGAAILLRLVLKFVTRNDVEIGMECALKRFVGRGSLLWNEETVRYDFC